MAGITARKPWAVAVTDIKNYFILGACLTDTPLFSRLIALFHDGDFFRG